MIAASEPQEFVPYGRQKLKSHPGVIIPPSNPLATEQQLAHQLSKVNIDSHTEKECWSIRELVVGEGEGKIKAEEELYFRDKTAVWSRGTVGRSVGNSSEGDLPSGRTLVCCYSVDSAITHALWVNFIKPSPNTAEEVPLPSICLLDKTKINIYTKGGEDFISTLQFKVSSVWSCKFGMLLERYTTPQLNESEQSLATLFSLLHPLDEIAPMLLMRIGGTIQYMNDSNLKVVFSSEDPPLVVLFNIRTGVHSAWKLRKASPQEIKVFSGSGDQSSFVNTSSLHLSNISQMSSGSFSHKNDRTQQTPVTENIIPQPFSPFEPLSKIQSPIDRFRSSLPGMRNTPIHTPTLGRRTHTSLSSVSALEARMGISQTCTGLREPRPIEPQLTLEYLWAENLGVPLVNKNVAIEQANRVFLTTDVLNQTYLCYLLKTRAKLMVARLNLADTGHNSEAVVGSVVSVDALDAAPLLSLQMTSVLVPGGGVTLYTGTTPVGKVHVAGIYTALASSSYLTSVTTMGFMALTPFPKRSSMLSSTQTGEALFDDSLHQLSPVQAAYTSTPRGLNQDSRVHALRDPVDNRLTLEFRSGIMFRISLPEVCSSPLVKRCLETLKCGLPQDVAVQVFTQWYTARNAPGPQDIPPHHEWQLFSKLIFCCLGYESNNLSGQSDILDTPVQIKKKRSSDLGSPEDWLLLTQSEHHRAVGPKLCGLLGLKRCEGIVQEPVANQGHVNTSGLLFHYFHNVLYLLHLLYEELKLNLLMSESLPLLASLLQQLATDLRLHRYVLHYWKDFPATCTLRSMKVQLDVSDVPQKPDSMSPSPPDIFHHLQSLLRRVPDIQPYPSSSLINPQSTHMIQIVGMLCIGQDDVQSLLQPMNINGSQQVTVLPSKPPHLDIMQHCVYLISSLGYSRRDLTMLPAGLALVLNDAIHQVREDPPMDWPELVYRLIGRQDLAATPPPPSVGERGAATTAPPASTRNTQDSDDGMESMDREILKLRFNKDQRVGEVRRLLQSSQPVTIAILQRPEVSDHEFIEEQEKHLYTICTRTMALPVGRGMVTLHTACPVASEPLNIPRLCLSGRAPPRGTTVDLTHIDVVPNMNLWPLFHNGVAAGLRIAPSASNIDTAWIVYNKPKAGPEALPEHAGFLMALGLSGHLGNLAEPNTCEYLSRSHEMTSIAILLGIAATKRGSMDLYTTKMLSLHVESLLPPTSVELDIPQNVQVAALISVGLVYQATGHHHMTDILLSEMGRPPGPEMENSVDRESYSLAAGLALGMVVLGQGSEMSGLGDIGIADTLHYYMVGGNKRPLTGSQKEKYKSPSYQIREGDCVNIAVTSPGATLALGMMFFNTGNKAVAAWMAAPDTQYLLDFVCPDALLLRTLAKGLILWEDIRPSQWWVESHVPLAIRPYYLVKPRPGTVPDSLDLETMNQAYCNILAGACMAMGLRFAGSYNNDAFTTLLHYCKMLTSLSGKSLSDLVGKSTIEACLNVVIVSLALVMAGSGDLEVLRVCRYLHSRVGVPTVTYGSQLATHMALGLLFLGGGRYTLGTSPPAIAALLCAFFPKYPTHSNDNRYHLQALRHLYVLAAECRLVLPRDIDTGSLCYAHLRVFYLDTDCYKDQSFSVKAPCILPELKYLKKVVIEDDRYWKVTFTRDKNWTLLQSVLNGYVGVKQRAGCLSYLEDPHGFRSLLAQTLTTDKSVTWTVQADSIFSFSSDPSTVNFAHYFLEQPEGEGNDSELQVMQFLTKIVYECVTQDKLSTIPIWITIIKAMQCLRSATCGPLVWQLKLLIAHNSGASSNPFIAPEMALSVKHHAYSIVDSWENELIGVLVNYMKNEPLEDSPLIIQRLAVYLNFLDFPAPDILAQAPPGQQSNPFTLRLHLGQDVPDSTIHKINKLCQIMTQAQRLISHVRPTTTTQQ